MSVFSVNRMFLGAAVLAAAAPMVWLSGCTPSAPVQTGEAKPSSVAGPAGDSAASVELPKVELIGAEGLRAKLAESRGKVVVINFWATWCPPCVSEMPYFAELYTKYAGKPLSLLSLSADAKDTIEKAVIPFQKEKKLPFPIWVLDERDPDAFTAVLGKELSGALPETLIFSKEGELVKTWEGEVTLAQLEEVIVPLL
ncbi:MAG: hypothetical protein RLZZ303_3315 [Candidatus Hydrogenedentota bacterium]